MEYNLHCRFNRWHELVFLSLTLYPIDTHFEASRLESF